MLPHFGHFLSSGSGTMVFILPGHLTFAILFTANFQKIANVLIQYNIKRIAMYRQVVFKDDLWLVKSIDN
jgi:trehalose utilization protein